ncbi:helix-turn-helix domain-containing protein [Escherichia coli]|uniref:helix-turn-helix domain-containing protein n=1 Tax=Escherichia coli TaxID=562 RepID=UPI001BFD37EF|nr:helix-turn-helix domain-containing protein [Escherichia coli]
MSYSLTDKAFRLITGSKEVSFVMVTLAWYADHDKNQCFPSIDTIAKRCCMKRNTVVSSVHLLEKWGVLNKQRRYRTSNIYTFSDKFVSVVDPKKDIFIEDFILQDSKVKVSQTALRLPKEESQSIPNGTSIPESKYPQGYANKEDIIYNKEDIKQCTPYTEKNGSISEEDQSADLAASRVLAHYNNKFNSRHKEKKYFINLLKKTKTRSAYTEEDLIMVIDWIAETWSFKPEPIKIARVNRFDEYLAKAEQWRKLSATVNAADVVEAFNITFDGLLPLAEMDRDLERKIHRLSEHMKNRSIDSFVNYFDYFRKHAPPFYFGENGSGWIADIDFLLKPETLRKTRNFP